MIATEYVRTERPDGKFTVKPATPPFGTLEDAGVKVAARLIEVYGQRLKDAVVLGCVRGGLPGAKVVVQKITEYLERCGIAPHHYPQLDMVIIRKFNLPERVLKIRDISIGAVAENGEVFYLESFAKDRGIDLHAPDIKPDLDSQIDAQREELKRRIAYYRGKTAPVSLEGKLAIFFDDGMANGTTMIAALGSRKINLQKTIVAIPVCSQVGLDRLHSATQIPLDNICYVERIPLQKTDYWDCSDFYKEIRDVNDEEVVAIMKG